MKSRYMTKPNDLCKIADELREKEFYKQAVSKYLNAIMLERDNAKVYFGLGICYKHLENYQKAISYLEKSAELEKDYGTFFELGVCNLLDGFPCRAIKCFVEAVKLNPKSSDAILQLGICHELCEEYDMALMIYKYVMTVNPNIVKNIPNENALDIFEDTDEIAPYALNAIKWCVSNNLISGKGAKLDPTTTTTRAECAAVIRSMCLKFGM